MHDLLEAARVLQPETVALRRSLHRHPEVGLHLPETRDKVLAALSGLPLEIHLHSTTSGIVAVLNGSRPGPTVLLRGDMDALPLQEDTGLEFASENDGAMHACGHDLHTSMLVAAARLLAARTDHIAGKVVFMFQPGEEGAHGARYMLEEGLLDVTGQRPIRALATHVSSGTEYVGMATRSGPFMAAADTVSITVTGRGGHASAPHNAIDPILVAAEIISTVQTAITREIDVFDPAVVTFANLHAGTTHNVIPETAMLEGTIRTFSDETRTRVIDLIDRVGNGVAAAHGASALVRIEQGYPVTANDEDVAADALRLIAALIGEERAVRAPFPIMGSEDWSYVLEEVPGAMVFISANHPDLEPEERAPNHSNLVVFDEDIMPSGAALYAAFALDALAVDGASA